jgi:pyruvate dehydrogenase E2 component (dihydrolipoamide acetyltransferase)
MDIVVPKVGLTVEFAEVLHWHAQPGQEVRAGEPLVDLAADKADLEIEAPADGVLGEILADVGAEVRPGEVIGRIGGAVGAASPAADEPPAQAATPDELVTAGNGAATTVAATPVARRVAADLGVDLATVDGSGARGRVRRRDVERQAANGNGNGNSSPDGRRPSSPAARRLADELGVALEAATGTGPGGRIVEADVRRAAEAAPPAPATPPPAASGDELSPARWTAARRMTARRMAESAASVAPVTLHRRADAGAAMAAARALKERGVRATFTHVLMACTAAALREHPEANSVWEGDKLMRAHGIHLGLAVDVDGGLFVPVIRDADALSVGDLATIAAGLVTQCRTGSIAPEALGGSTFSISNLGMLGVEQFTPIVNPPHVAILGVGAAVDEAVPGPDGLRFRKACHLSLTFDHRALDGAPAARFLDAIVGRLESFAL